jgi:serine/threonine protein kinase
VYKGLWAGQSVAVKKLKHGTRRQVEEFRNEVRVLAKLRHPNITTFYGVTTHDSLIVTELLHGSLYKLLHVQDHPLSEAIKRRIAKDVACGAAYIHGLNPSIVHRDINSSNVLLTGDITVLGRIVEENRNEPLAKLSDFGLSRSVERFMTQCTGNAYYLAPGQSHGHGCRGQRNGG